MTLTENFQRTKQRPSFWLTRVMFHIQLSGISLYYDKCLMLQLTHSENFLVFSRHHQVEFCDFFVTVADTERRNRRREAMKK